MSIPGVLIDISSNNAHPINWAAVKASGVIGVFVKATDGTGYTNPYYAGDIAGALAAGIPALGYHFAEFTDPVAEARHFLLVAGARARVLDSETSTDAAWQNEFLGVLGLPSTEEVDYGSASTLPTGVRALLWPAAYGQGAPGEGEALWQYTDVGRIGGINGDVDLSTWLGSQEAFDMLFGISTPPVPVPPPPEASRMQDAVEISGTTHVVQIAGGNAWYRWQFDNKAPWSTAEGMNTAVGIPQNSLPAGSIPDQQPKVLNVGGVFHAWITGADRDQYHWWRASGEGLGGERCP